jgi:hypothetical protein
MIDIYLALPYMHNSPTMMDLRADISDIISVDLANQGYAVFAPISAWHKIAVKYGMRGDWEFWKHFDEAFIKCCKKVSVIKLPGWNISTGVTAEINIAEENDIEVDYIEPLTYLYNIEELIESDVEMDSTEKFKKLLMIGHMINSVEMRKVDYKEKEEN